MSALLAIEGASLVRGGRLLFEDLSLTLEPGGALQVTGPNGCGKSSLLRMIAGLLKPSAGRVSAAPLALSDDRLALDRELPLRAALLFWAKLTDREAGVDPAMEAARIAHLAEVPVRLLSTGQARRASLARVAASGARLWLLDEPLNGLDSAGALALERMIAAHRAEGGGVLAASHWPLPGDWRTLSLAQTVAA